MPWLRRLFRQPRLFPTATVTTYNERSYDAGGRGGGQYCWQPYYTIVCNIDIYFQKLPERLGTHLKFKESTACIAFCVDCQRASTKDACD
jgi:hypothetical protein